MASGTVHCCLTSALVTARQRPPSTSRLACESTRPRAGITLKSSKSGHVKLTEVFREPTQVSEGVSWKLAQGKICMSKYAIQWFRLWTKVGPNLTVSAVEVQQGSDHFLPYLISWRCRWAAGVTSAIVKLGGRQCTIFAALFVRYCRWGSILRPYVYPSSISDKAEMCWALIRFGPCLDLQTIIWEVNKHSREVHSDLLPGCGCVARVCWLQTEVAGGTAGQSAR